MTLLVTLQCSTTCLVYVNCTLLQCAPPFRWTELTLADRARLCVGSVRRRGGAHRRIHHHHQSLNREGRWGATDNFATSFLHFPLSSVAFWDLGKLQACPFPDVVFPPLLLSALSSSPLSLCLARWFWPDLMNWRHDHSAAVCVSLRSSGGLRVVRLPAGSWHGLPRW